MARISLAVLLVVTLGLVSGCGASSQVSLSDMERNKKEFSQEAYEAAMIKAGKGAELEEEKRRNAERAAQEADQR